MKRVVTRSRAGYGTIQQQRPNTCLKEARRGFLSRVALRVKNSPPDTGHGLQAHEMVPKKFAQQPGGRAIEVMSFAAAFMSTK